MQRDYSYYTTFYILKSVLEWRVSSNAVDLCFLNYAIKIERVYGQF